VPPVTVSRLDLLVSQFIQIVFTCNMSSISGIILFNKCRNAHSSNATGAFNPDFFSVVFNYVFKWKFSFHK